MAFFPPFFLLKEVNNVAGLFLDKEWAREDFSGLFVFFFLILNRLHTLKNPKRILILEPLKFRKDLNLGL